MSIYVYNSTISTNTYVTEDYGSISSSVDASVDYSAGTVLPSQTIIDYTTYLYTLPTDFSSTAETFDAAPNFDNATINFSSTSTLDQAQTFDSALYENFGNIYDNSTLTPFGSLDLELTSGTVSETEVYVASGTLFNVGVLDENVTFAWVGSGTVFEIGGGLERTVKPYIASGTLRMDASAAAAALERVTKSYNLSSIYSPQLDWGSITIPVIGGDDFSLITETPAGSFPYDNFGLVSDIATSYPLLPFGRFRFVSYSVDNDNNTCDSGEITCDSGTSANVSFTSGAGESTIFCTFSGTASESFSAQTPEDTQLFTIFGELVHPNIDYTPHYGIDVNIGIGTTGIKFGSRGFPERFTFSYNEYSPCYDSFAESVDYGFVYGIPTSPIDSVNPDFFDYGLVSENDTGNIPDDAGWTSEPLGVTCPFGSTYISGTASESFSADTPDNTQLFSISGVLVESNTESYVGFGTHRFNVGIFSSPLSIDNTRITFDSNNIYFNDTEFRYDAIVSFSADTPDNTQLFSISGVLVESNTESYVGFGTLSLSGTASESFSAQTPEDTQLFSVSGTSLESFSADTPDNTQLFSISGVLVESNTESYVGFGTLSLSGTSLESFSADTPDNTQLFSVSGTASESFSADTPDNTQLFSISGVLVESNTESYVGIITLTLSNTALESFSADTPDNTQLFSISGVLVESNTESYVGVGSFGFVPGVGFAPDGDGNLRDAKTYSNRYGFQIGDFNLGSGIGTIRLLGTAKTRKTPRFEGQGAITLSNSATESFCVGNYDGSGSSTFSGIASTREIAVYGYYGDDRDPGTSGLFTISGGSIERNTDSYFGFGQLTFSGNSEVLITNSFRGSGLTQFSGTALESFSAQTPENIELFSISGTGLEVYSAQTPETEVLYIINGFIEESITDNYVGSGSATLSGSSSTLYVSNYTARGVFRFTTHNVDNDYDTCDSEEFTCDSQDSAYVSFTANPPENTILFNLGGIAVTSEIATYTNVGVGLFTLFGTYESIRFAYSQSGIGTIFLSEVSSESEGNTYIGSGNLFTFSGLSESYSAQTPENTVLIQISGSATTSIEFEYSVVGIGLFTVSGSAITSEIATYTQIGSGTITLSGELLYPDVVYIPSPDGSGLINILGSSDDSIAKVYDNTFGSLFSFSSGLESFTKSTYIGLGTIYIQELSGSTINNPFQIPRTYVVII